MRGFVAFLAFAFLSVLPAAQALTIQLPYEPVTLDPASVEDGVGIRVMSVLFRGLMQYDSSGRLELGLAASYRVDARQPRLHRYIFKLRAGLQWSDGVALEADHFVLGLKRALDPKRLAKLSDQLFLIRGARDYKEGRLKDFSKVGVHALSKTEIAFDLEKGFGVFPHVLALPVALPFRPDMEKGDFSAMPTTGPYFLKQWTRDVRITCARNPKFAAGAAGPDAVNFEIVPDDSTARDLFERGRLDVLTKINPIEAGYWKKHARVLDLPYAGVYYLAFDLRHGGWASVPANARAQVSAAIDRDAIVRSVDAAGKAARGWLLPLFEPEPGCCRAPSASAPESKGLAPASALPKKILLVYDSGSRNQTVAERVQEDLKGKLGLSVELRSRDWKSYLGALASGGFESRGGAPVLYRMGWLSPVLNAYGNFLIFHSGDPNNYSGWNSPRLDALLDELGMLDPEAPRTRRRRAEIVKSLESEVVGAGVFIPLYDYTQQYVLGPQVQRFTANALGQLFF